MDRSKSSPAQPAADSTKAVVFLSTDMPELTDSASSHAHELGHTSGAGAPASVLSRQGKAPTEELPPMLKPGLRLPSPSLDMMNQPVRQLFTTFQISDHKYTFANFLVTYRLCNIGTPHQREDALLFWTYGPRGFWGEQNSQKTGNNPPRPPFFYNRCTKSLLREWERSHFSSQQLLMKFLFSQFSAFSCFWKTISVASVTFRQEL